MSGKVCIRVFADIEQINRCKSKLQANESSIYGFSRILGLAGNDVRFKILYLLSEEKELCVCDLSDILDMNISAVSQHLRKLKDGDIVDIRKEGQTYFYFIREANKSIVDSFMKLIN